MTRDEMLRRVAELHYQHSVKYAGRVPYNPADENPHDGQTTDLSLWNVDRSAPPEIDDELNVKIMELINAVHAADQQSRSSYGRVTLHPDPGVREAIEDALHLPDLPPDVHARYSDDQERDESGRFAGGGGGGGGSSSSSGASSSSGVRPSLANTKTVDEVAAVTTSELNAITGRDHGQGRIIFHGDHEIAQQHAEGILRAQAEHPEVVIGSIGTFDPRPGSNSIYVGQGYDNTMAVSNTYRNLVTGRTESSIRFNKEFTEDPAKYAGALRMSSGGWLSDPTPTGIASHEFGHAWADQHKGNTAGRQAATRHAGGRGATAMIRSQISDYATTNSHELSAESFAQVMSKGDGASPIARAVYDAINGK